MFSRFTTALYNAVDALAPPHPLQEDFIWHWKAITRYFTAKNASNKTPIEVTSIPGHLLEMLSILEQEEKETESGNVGPCMEYIMQHKLLDTMCILASSDTPPGMKRYMFMFVTKMLKIIQQSLIPHVSIYVPIQNFIELCGEIIAGPTESEEMEFLQCVCNIISENPHLVNCFLSKFKPKKRSTTSYDTGACSKDAESVNDDYPLITSLLKLYKSPDNDISSKAKECIRSLCSCANDTAAMTVAQFTSLSQVLCSSVVTLYHNIPKSIKTHDLENPGDEDEASSKISPEKRKYLCYLQQLMFIDSLTEFAHPIISDHIVQCFRTEFLNTCLYSDLVENENEDDLIYVTTLIGSTLRNLSSSKLITAFSVFLLGDDDDDGANFSEHHTLVILDVLIDRCRNSGKSVALSLCNLQLFEELLLRPTQSVLNNLILKYLDGRGYYDITAADSWLQFSDDETCSRYSDDFSPRSSPTPKEPGSTYINKIIESFLALLPDHIKSCETEEESGYETYIKEAHGRFMKCLVLCEDFDWPQEIPDREENQFPADDDSSSESQPEADSANWAFYEGPFLNMIFDKLESMIHQPYEINLQLTSIISRLALFAHPLLHEYLLNPLIPYAPDARSLFLVLLKVSEEIQKEVSNVRGFKSKIKLTRNALLSDGNEYATFEESPVLEALIVFEEFCKELAAIAFVKYHAVS